MIHVDPALVRACQLGDPGAMDALIRESYADVFALARRMMGNPDDAADVTQEVYLRVVRSVLGFRGESAFGTWLHRVTVNVCLTALKRRSAARSAGTSAGYSAFAVPDDPAAAGLASAEDVGEQVASHDLATRTARALDRLGDDARTVVVLRDVQGLSTKEVAAMLGVSESVVKVRLHRAHARLRALVLPDPGLTEPGRPAPEDGGER